MSGFLVTDRDVDAVRADIRLRQWNETVPARFRDASFADVAGLHGDQVADDLTDWAYDVDAGNLVLLGPTGCGKTYAAISAVRSRFFNGETLVFAPTVEVLDDLRPGGDGSLSRYVGADTLVLDDLGAERPSQWTAERLFAIVNRRWLEKRPTVATSNIAPDLLEQVLGARTYSRLVGGAVALQLTGADQRRAS